MDNYAWVEVMDVWVDLLQFAPSLLPPPENAVKVWAWGDVFPAPNLFLKKLSNVE